MRLSLSWLIVLILLAFIVFFFLYGCKVYEDYVDVTEGFANTIQIETCPPQEGDESAQMISKIPHGSTLTYCYDNGVSMCSLSVPQDSPESCSTYYAKLLKSHGAKKCPASMPNYFQHLHFEKNVDSSLRGCTAGAISSDGKSPADITAPKCTIYKNQKDDMEQLDSCTNIKMLDATQCFSTNLPGATKKLIANTMGSPFVQCTYTRVEVTDTKVDYTQDVNGNNGTVSCEDYCEGINGGPWNGELPVDWNGAMCIGVPSNPSLGCEKAAGVPVVCTCTKTGQGWYNGPM
jgi:hypothetical protein